MLKLQFKDRRQEAIWLVDPLFTVGSSPQNSLVINGSGVASIHAEIRSIDNKTTISCRDPHSALYLNNERVINEKTLSAGDVIKLGDVELDVIDPHSTQYQSAIGMKPGKAPEWQLKSTASWMENQVFPINQKASIGRDASCDISIPVEHLSRHHVEVEVKGGKLLVKDLDSANGTFLNGKQITECYAKSGDKIKLDVITFEVIGPAQDPNKTIIRSAPSDKPARASKPTNKANPKSAPVKRSAKRKPAIPVKQRPLASGGKQDWIEEPVAVEKKSHYWWFAIAGFVLTLLAVILFISR
ncbi:FHA domain-containing protein [Alkalimarinus coralli]|uniref:FHA domain-containing protein n=1 Tax=Alkalimarinus coralli TaxID=2935863 RepID=UPI00202B9B5C|nr:FHA domain-containing protein [Alkalimarinus coralli]